MGYRDRFWYGASYSPLVFPESEWDHDLSLMAKAGMNIIRLGDVHGSWDRIEPQEGNFEFDLLEKFYIKAAGWGQAIMISTGSASPPLWLAQKYPDLPILSNTNMRYPLGSSYGWVCIHHAGYREALHKYLLALLSFIQKQPNHFGWQISNEIGFPFLPPRGSKELDIFCYCEHCQAAFRNWVHDKYGSLNKLNQAWAWGTTYLTHHDWSDVFAPQGLPSGWASVTKWIDWRLFWQDAFTKFAGWQHHILKEIDPDHPTSINTFNFKGYDRFGALMGLDQWKLAAQTDHIGYDLYPGSGNKLASRPEHNSMFLDHGRSVAQNAKTDFWLHEIESGPIGGWVMGPDHNTNAIDIIRNGFEATGHDVKLMMYMPWREWDYQPLRWGALVDLDGNKTPRLEAAATVGNFIKDHESILLSSHPIESEIAILESKANAIFFNGIDQEEELFNAQRGAYSAFWDLGYNLDFIDVACLDQTIEKYRIILLPMMSLLDMQSAEILQEYVKQGGTLIGFARCGALNEMGWYEHIVPIAPLKEVFGIRSSEPDLLNNHQVIYGDQIFEGWHNRDVLKLQEGTQVLATFDDRHPAVTLHPYHKGRAIYISTQSDAAYVSAHNYLLPTLIKDLDLPVPHIVMNYDQRTRRDIDAHVLVNPKGGMIIFTNYRPVAVNADVQIDLPAVNIHTLQQIFPEKREIRLTSSDKGFQINLEFKGEEVKIIQFFY
ncbi:MAG: family 14 glycosylhydrolase [Chloroflexi bacterium]|nr:family 14 glycosylhydrolase [Chloroflexota bacterium]